MILSSRFEHALSYTARLHARQKRKGSDIPYVSHLLGVASIALEYGATEDEAIAALLHDAIEDQGGAETREEIRERFGDTIVEIVVGCTDADEHPKPPWRMRKETFIVHVRTASHSVRLVSAADKLHNLRSIVKDYREIGDALWPRFQAGQEGTLWYYRSLYDAFCEVERTPLVEEVGRTLAELVELISNNPSE
jgi:(p)ppGpp synthase/HD superfamily hydrolase